MRSSYVAIAIMQRFFQSLIGCSRSMDWAADTSNGCFQPQPMQSSIRSGRLLAALHPGCATLVPSIFFPPGCVILSGGRPRGNHHRRSIGEFILEKRFRGRASAVAHPLATSSQRSVHILILSIPLKLFSVQVSFPFYCIFNE